MQIFKYTDSHGSLSTTRHTIRAKVPAFLCSLLGLVVLGMLLWSTAHADNTIPKELKNADAAANGRRKDTIEYWEKFKKKAKEIEASSGLILDFNPEDLLRVEKLAPQIVNPFVKHCGDFMAKRYLDESPANVCTTSKRSDEFIENPHYYKIMKCIIRYESEGDRTAANRGSTARGLVQLLKGSSKWCAQDSAFPNQVWPNPQKPMTKEALKLFAESKIQEIKERERDPFFDENTYAKAVKTTDPFNPAFNTCCGWNLLWERCLRYLNDFSGKAIASHPKCRGLFEIFEPNRFKEDFIGCVDKPGDWETLPIQKTKRPLEATRPRYTDLFLRDSMKPTTSENAAPLTTEGATPVN